MYVPTFNPNTEPAGLPDGDQRRITKMGKVRISRFTMDLDTKELDLGSETIIFEYETQLWSCCHRGGGMGFDSEGNLYITTGDSNSSQGTSGTSGNNPVPTCPTGDPNEATNAHCGDNGVSYQDARRTAGNTNDYNGKLLRIKPIASIPDGEQPPIGIGTTYEIPGPDAPNGPNLFDGTEGNGNQAKPEIFAMGLRNPARLAIDPKTDIPYTAWVGPDAGAPNGNLGPSSFEVAAQISQAGNYGWPYCADGRQAYRDRTADGQVRTDSPEGYVDGGPGGTIPGWYDCDNLINDSIRNTGLTVLPHETGTGMDAGTARQANVWYGRGNPGGANGCPVFPREGSPDNAPNYAGQPTALCPYITASGATVMSGPVYRYDESAGNQAWPEYWDGRWFLHDFSGGQSVRHGLLLDPETADEGGQPVYADNMKQIITWSNGNYMDSKFGPDGALYVQLYGPYFRVGDGNGIYRVTYTGGPDTPGPDPQWHATGNPLEIQFSIGASGGVSYAWDFDDDGETDSTDPSPTHTYANAGPKQVKLTVTYADGEEASKTITVNVSDDNAPPTTTATLDPAEPGPGGTYEGPVTITLEADDGDGSGVALTQYRINGGAFKEYTEPFTISADGDYVVEFRSRDEAGNVEEIQQITFSIQTAPGEGCPQTDEFDGAVLDSKWMIRNDTPSLREISDGALRLTTGQGDVRGPSITAPNTLLQNVPEGPWTATIKLDHTAIQANGQAAGIAMLASENPGYLAKTAVQWKDNDFHGNPMNGKWVERSLTTDSSDNTEYGWPGEPLPQFPNSGKLDPPTDDLWIRVRFDGTNVHTEYSYDGNEWEPSAPEFPASEFGEDGIRQVGLFAKYDGGANVTTVPFDYFRVTSPGCDGGSGDVSPPTTTATTNPAEPDGENGWFVSPVEVTLEADDGEGSGVATTEYRIDGGEWQMYTEPFVVGDTGRHEVNYRSTDHEGNAESAKTLRVNVDLSPPNTTGTAEGDGPFEVTLSAEDEGSGVAKTEFRIDGGEWQEYASEQPILADADDLANWKMAGPGNFVWHPDEGGFFRTQGGLGMLWYTAREFGDFSLKMQWRDNSPEGSGNSGILARFPNPDEAVSRPADERYPCQVGSAETQPAWVAIFCGHEIQINDHQGDVQKTGSIYNFDPVLAPDHKPQPKGTWSTTSSGSRGRSTRSCATARC